MSLYGGLYGGLEDVPKSKPTKKDEETKDKTSTQPSSTTKWKANLQMMAPHLKRKRQQELAAKAGALRAAAKAKVAANPFTKTKTVVVGTSKPSVEVQNVHAVSNTGSEAFVQPQETIEYKDEYVPRRPNDYEYWHHLIEKENKLADESKNRDRDRNRDRQRDREQERSRSTRNTAAIAPPTFLTTEENRGPGLDLKKLQNKLVRPNEKDDIDAQNPFSDDDDDSNNNNNNNTQQSSDPFANMPMVGFGAKSGTTNSSDSAAVVKASVAMSGEDAYAARGRLSGKQPPPQPSSQGMSIGAKLMQKYGHEVGKGLGQQRVAPPKDNSLFKTPTFSKPATPSKPKTQIAPSRVVLLTNMIGPDEVDSELNGEISDECSKYGTVVKCVVHECPRGSVPESEAVRVFVEFARQEAAIKAFQAMSGRYFGGRTVKSQYYDLSMYMQNRLI